MFRLSEVILWCLLFSYLVLWSFPMSVWYEVGRVEVSDTIEGIPPRIEYDGGPVRDSTIKYQVIIRESSTKEVVSDDSSDPFLYEVNSKRPDNLDLKWWSPRHKRLKPGNYVMITCWTIYERFFGLVPPRTVCVKSNIFRVFPNEG